MQLFGLTTFLTKRRFLISTIVAVLFFVFTTPSLAYEGLTELGILGGYSAVYRNTGTPPILVNSAALGVNIRHHLSDSIGIGLEVNYDIQPSFKVYESGIIEGDEGDYVGWVEAGTIDHSSLKSATLSASYALDVMRIIPYFALGITMVQSYQKSEGSSFTGYGLGGRLDLGADYLACKHLGLGLVFQNDIYFFGDAAFQTRLAFLFKITFILDVSKFGIKLAS